MKNRAFVFVLIFIGSCATKTLTTEEIEQLEAVETNNIEIIFTTTQLNYDEAMVTYYDLDKATDISKPYVFKYDTDGNPLPLQLVFENYKYEFLDGEAYRNNFSEAELRVQVLINGELFLERFSNGTSNSFARVNFSFDIPD